MIDLTSENFESEVTQSKVPVIVLWGAAGNIQSNLIALTLIKFIRGTIKLTRVDIDAHADLAMKFSIRNLPFLMLFVDGLAVVGESDLSVFQQAAAQWIG